MGKNIFACITLALVGKISFAQPAIISFFPTSGPVGTSVVITGINFNTSAINNIVYFGSVKATVTTATSTSLTVIAPAGITFQPISVTSNGLTAFSNKPFIITYTSGTLTTNSFASRVDLSANPVAPSPICISDIDNDGKPDIVAGSVAGAVSIYKNNSSGSNLSFATQVNFSAGDYHYNIAIGDLDGDGKQDIVVPNFGFNTISILKNTSSAGTISFSPSLNYVAGVETYGIAISDLDSDGKPDIVSTNQANATVSVFRNTSMAGSISFAPKIDFITNITPRGMAINDINNDRKPDLVIASQYGHCISILENTSTPGNISFAAKVDLFTTNGSYPESVSIGDLDGDDQPDIAVANNNAPTGTISVFRNTTLNGNISFAGYIDLLTGNNSNPYIVGMGDIDGDGKPDIMINNQNLNVASIFRNTSYIGTISFDSKVDYTTAAGSRGLAIGDLDVDGKTDFAIPTNGLNIISIFRNNIQSALPLSLLHFSAKLKANQTELSWETAIELNTSFFGIEHSADGVSFKDIGNVTATGNVDLIRNYNFIHPNPKSGINYYRLRITDIDGKFSYSKILRVQFSNEQTKLSIFPNPAGDYTTISLSPIPGESELKIIDMKGILIKTYKINKNILQTKISTKELVPGVYDIIWRNNTGILNQRLLIKIIDR